MNRFSQKFPHSFCGRDWRRVFNCKDVEDLACEIDHLYEFAPLTAAERRTFLQAHFSLKVLDLALRDVDVSRNYTNERPEVPGNTVESAIGYLFRMQTFVDRLWEKYIGMRPMRDI